MAQYWECGELPWPDFKDIEEFVDEQVGDALKDYIESHGVLIIEWWEEPEPVLAFWTDDFFHKQSLYELLLEELEGWRPFGTDENELFFDPEGDRRVILLQELVRTYLKWKEGGVHQPAKESEE